MKKYTTLVIIITVVSSSCLAQGSFKRTVSLVKESAKIDSLLSAIINIPKYLKAPKDDSCIVLCLGKSDPERYVYGLHAINHREIIFDIGNLKNKKRLGYFNHKGYLIFVYGDAFMNEFFIYTNLTKEFIFVKPKAEETLSLMRNFMSWAVIYRDGELNYGVH